ncbi:MAG: site-2 protease family protein [Candidatus Nanoarchaeia archaeon]
MPSFLFYDITFLVVFAIFLAWFLYNGRKNINKEGLLLLYKASWGIKLIKIVGKKYKKTLKALSYVSIGLGYILMASVLWLFGKIVWIYAFNQNIVRAIKVPPIIPLIPYLPQIFNLDFLPPFFFTYWIVIIALIAIPHEFFHGIFAARDKIHIKTTGFGFFPFFLPVFLAAFVELDEPQMAKKSKFSQLAVLSAGTFANVLTAILFFIILLIFFSLAFTPAGVMFTSYSNSIVNVSDITTINGINFDEKTYDNLLDSLSEEDFTEVKTTSERNYLATKDIINNSQNERFFESNGQIILFNDAPAIRAGLQGAITEINGVKIINQEGLGNELNKYSPGEIITIKTVIDNEEFTYEIKLAEHPLDPSRPMIGIGFINQQREGILGKTYNVLSSFREPNTYYKSSINDELGLFIYNLLWWIILISLSVALVNMLPVGIFDGGRFFYLTILGLTGSEKTAQKSFKFVTWLFLFLILLLMVFWGLSFR